MRENVRDLTPRQRRDFVAAVLRLKSTRSPYDRRLSYYDQFVSWHRELSRCHPSDPFMRHMQMGHAGPMFLPWHRLFTLLFENALREVSGKDIAIPYWDWTDPGSTPVVFSEDLMGGDGDANQGYAVTTGPFRKGRWHLVVHPVGLEYASSATPYITRRFGSFLPPVLPTRAEVNEALAAHHYDVPPYNIHSDPRASFRNALEGWDSPVIGAMTCGPDSVMISPPHNPKLHNGVHTWVGGLLAPRAGSKLVGTMTAVPSSVNDPVFFLHHANIDRIWAEWQRRHGIHTYRPLSGHHMNNADDVMHPFDQVGIRATPETVADIRALGYRYGRLGSSPAPRLTSLRLSRRRFRAARRGRALVPRGRRLGRRVGTRVRYRLSADARVIFRVQRARRSRGRFVGGRCVRRTRRNTRRRRCTRYRTLRGRLVHRGHRGTNRWRFSGRWRGRRLRRGRYRLIARALDGDGRPSRQVRARFRIVRR